MIFLDSPQECGLYMCKNNSYVPSDRQMRHVREVLNLMSAMTEDTRFAEVTAVSRRTSKT